MVLQGERTRKLRTLGPFDPGPPINHFRNGSKTPAISKIDVKVFSNISAATCNSESSEQPTKMQNKKHKKLEENQLKYPNVAYDSKKLTARLDTEHFDSKKS